MRYLWIAVLLGSGVAHADSESEAAALFDQGVKDLEAHQLDKACPELSASLAKRPDIVTQATLADCDTKAGKVASAWRLWRDLAKTAPDPDLQAEAAANAKLLEPRLPRLLIKLPAAPAPGLVIAINGEHVDSQMADLAVPVPVDPGSVEVSATAPTFKPSAQHFTAVEGKTIEVTIPGLESEQPTTPPVAVVVPPPMKIDSSTRHGSYRKWVAISVGVTGAASLATGVVFGLNARSSWNSALALCPDSSCPPNFVDRTAPSPQFIEAQHDKSDAQSAATLATVFVGVGVAALVGGAYLYFTAPKTESPRSTTAWRVTPALGQRSAGLVLSGELP